MILYCTTLKGTKIFFEAKPDSTLGDYRQFVSKQAEIPLEKIIIIVDDQVLPEKNDEQQLAELNLNDAKRILIVQKLNEAAVEKKEVTELKDSTAADYLAFPFIEVYVRIKSLIEK